MQKKQVPPDEQLFFTPILFYKNEKYFNTFLYRVDQPYDYNTHNDNVITKGLQEEYQKILRLSTSDIIKNIARLWKQYIRIPFRNRFDLSIETLARQIILNYILLRNTDITDANLKEINDKYIIPLNNKQKDITYILHGRTSYIAKQIIDKTDKKMAEYLQKKVYADLAKTNIFQKFQEIRNAREQENAPRQPFVVQLPSPKSLTESQKTFRNQTKNKNPLRVTARNNPKKPPATALNVQKKPVKTNPQATNVQKPKSIPYELQDDKINQTMYKIIKNVDKIPTDFFGSLNVIVDRNLEFFINKTSTNIKAFCRNYDEKDKEIKKKKFEEHCERLKTYVTFFEKTIGRNANKQIDDTQKTDYLSASVSNNIDILDDYCIPNASKKQSTYVIGDFFTTSENEFETMYEKIVEVIDLSIRELHKVYDIIINTAEMMCNDIRLKENPNSFMNTCKKTIICMKSFIEILESDEYKNITNKGQNTETKNNQKKELKLMIDGIEKEMIIIHNRCGNSNTTVRNSNPKKQPNTHTKKKTFAEDVGLDESRIEKELERKEKAARIKEEIKAKLEDQNKEKNAEKAKRKEENHNIWLGVQEREREAIKRLEDGDKRIREFNQRQWEEQIKNANTKKLELSPYALGREGNWSGPHNNPEYYGSPITDSEERKLVRDYNTAAFKTRKQIDKERARKRMSPKDNV